MLITKELEYPILYEPALISGMKCNNLRIITGFTDCGRILTHLIALKDGSQGSGKKYVSGIKIHMILGMTKGQSLTLKKHKNICETIARKFVLLVQEKTLYTDDLTEQNTIYCSVPTCV